MSKGTLRLYREAGRGDLRAPPARKFPASALAALPAFSPSTPPRPHLFVSPPPTLPRVEGTRVGWERGSFHSRATGLPSQDARPLSGYESSALFPLGILEQDISPFLSLGFPICKMGLSLITSQWSWKDEGAQSRCSGVSS